MPETNMLIIDVATKDVRSLINKLIDYDTTLKEKLNLKENAIISAVDGGKYLQVPSLSQVHVETTLSEEYIDAWLYSDATNIEWIGVTTQQLK